MSRRALALLCLAAAGCAGIVGLDEYVRVDDSDACAEAHVLQEGRCTPVGVPSKACNSGFEPDGRGGCVAILPADRCLGQLARPGDHACVKPGCRSRPSTPSSADPVVYVRASAAEGGTGTLSRPFARIADAIASVESAPKPAIIIVEAGEYRENLVVTRSLHFAAACDVRLSADADRPAFRIEGRGAVGSTHIEGFEIVGGSAGIETRDAFVVVSNTQLRDSAGPGLLADASGPSQINLQEVLIEDALGAGVAVYGAELVIDNSTIRGTRPGAEGDDACGICVRPSGRVRSREMSVVPTWDPRTSTVGSLTLRGSLLEDNAGAGVSVIGTDAEVKWSVIRATGEAQSTGLEVEERVLGNLPGRLQVSQSLIEGMTLTGIRARNAYLQIHNSTVRDIRGAADSGAERCLGNGVRVIWDRAAEEQEPALKLVSSSIERTRETGVLIQGAHAEIDSSIVRDSRSARCGTKLGDGIGVYGHEFAPATLELEATRIERSDRASVASFGDVAINVRSSVALGADIVSSSAPIFAGTSCAKLNAARWQPCVVQDKWLPSALLGGSGCNPRDETVCIAICSREAGNPGPQLGVALAPDLRFWIVGHDEIAPVRSDRFGCADVEGLPRNARVALATAVHPEPGFDPMDSRTPLTPFTRALAPALNQVDTGESDAASVVHLGGQYDFGLVERIATLPARSDTPPSGLDLGAVPVFAVGICGASEERRLSTVGSCRPLAGVSVALDTGNLAHYPANDDVSSMGNATVQSPSGTLALFVNVPPGPRRFQLAPADPSRELECWTDARAGWSTATPLAEKNAFEAVARPGYPFNTMVLCELRDPDR